MATGCKEEAYTWSQTREELTIDVVLPSGTRSNNVRCEVRAGIAIQISLLGQPCELEILKGDLFDAVVSTVWTVEKHVLTLELEKKRARFWPRALQGGATVDVAALEKQEELNRQPAYKIPPDAQSKPRRVTDRETMLKLKAEFPQLAIDAADESTAEHRSYAGHRRQFDWGPLPAGAAAENAPSAAVPTKREQPALPVSGEGDGTVVSTHAAFQWGPVPGADACRAASTSVSTPQQVHAPTVEATQHSAPDAFSWGALPVG